MGVIKETLKAGDGVHFPKKGDTVQIHYTGTLTSNGKKFDSSVDRGSPFVTQIGVGKVIRGWDEGVPQLSLGEKALLKITYDYAVWIGFVPFHNPNLSLFFAIQYGERGYSPVIPPRADLTFEVELLKIN
ncbi:FK506-binding protein 1 [Dinochytrium kinnereticum]|nr:FK506-binding protein 1 [Dinochytrium kinnereticum]